MVEDNRMNRRFGIILTLACLLLALPWTRAWAREKAPTLRQLKQAVQENPQDPQAYYNLGLKYEAMGKDKEAAKAFRQALKLKPDYPEALYELGRLKGEAGETAQGIADLKKALKLKPDYAAARTGLGGEYNQEGLNLMEKGEWGKASQAFREALEANPDAQVREAARNNLGVALASEGKHEEARQEFRKVLEADPNNANAHYNFGVSSLALGNNVDAYREYLILRELDPEAAGELSYLIFQQKIESKRERISR
jgi:tetratricopeptide (TPR) repeat protein